MRTHTPGPWTFRRVGTIEGYYVEAASGRQDFPSLLVAKIPIWSASPGKSEAKARLIAAAPELLEKLREAADHLERMGRNGTYSCKEAGKRMRAVIARAEGVPPDEPAPAGETAR